MTPTIDNVLGQHNARLDGHDKELVEIREQAKEDRNELRGLKNLLMGCLAAACGGLVLQVVGFLAKK